MVYVLNERYNVIWFVWFLLLLLTLQPHYPAKQPLSEGQELKLKGATAVRRLIAVLLTSFSQGLSVQMYICECEQTEEKGKWWNQTIENLKFKAAMYIYVINVENQIWPTKIPNLQHFDILNLYLSLPKELIILCDLTFIFQINFHLQCEGCC